MEVLHSMKNGQQYSVLNFNRSTRSTSIDLYDYKTQSKVAALVDSKDLEAIPYFTNYTFSADESKIILATEFESIYRRSTLGVFFVYDIASKQLQKVSDSKIQEPTFSPDASQVAYGFNNNLYLKDLKSDREFHAHAHRLLTVVQVTKTANKLPLIKHIRRDLQSTHHVRLREHIDNLALRRLHQIGRASCRERV